MLLVTDPIRLPDPLAAMKTLPPGAGVLLRPNLAAPDVGTAVAIATLARRRRLVLLVAGDWRLADHLGADGLHLPESMARHGLLAAALGWRRRKGALLSVACHSSRALRRAVRLGADVALLSPVFATASHPGAPVIGAIRFGSWARRAGLPVLALGGVNPRTARRIPCGAATGLAAIGGLSE